MHRRELGRAGAPLGLGQRGVVDQRRPERRGPAALGDEGLGRADDLERVGLALLAGRRPRL